MSLFHKALYGDDTETPLPKTRRQAFFFYGKENALSLIFISLLSSLFFLPSLFWLYFMNYAKEKTLAAPVPGFSLPNYMFSHTVTVFLVLIPLLMLFFVGLAGAFSVVRQIVFARRFGPSHFFSGIRENGGRFLFLGFWFGISLFLLCLHFLCAPYFSSSIFSVFGRVASAVCFFFTCSAVMLCANEAVVYRVPFVKMLKNAVLLTFASPFRNMATVALLALPPVLTLLIPYPFQLLVLSALSLFLIGYACLLTACHCNALFDRYINPTLGEQAIRCGLRKL